MSQVRQRHGVCAANSNAPRRARRILGIDPGSRRTGYGVVEWQRGALRYVASGCVETAAGAFAGRLADIYRGVGAVIATHAPDEFAIEEVFVARNPASALKLGQARGVAIAAAVGAGLTVREYASRAVKLAVVGTGRAEKEQVQYMVRAMLGLDAAPSPDAADALAVAICHINTCRDAQAVNAPGHEGVCDISLVTDAGNAGVSPACRRDACAPGLAKRKR